jgi:two-component system chemotaxis response regulator CheY
MTACGLPLLDRVMASIVIIDDDVLVRGLMAEWLTAAGYRVGAAAGGHERTRTPADLVIVDVYMPRDLGVERLRAARSDYPDVPVIAISGQFRSRVGSAGPAAQALGVERVVAKPFGREDLLDAVRSVIGQPGVDSA